MSTRHPLVDRAAGPPAEAALAVAEAAGLIRVAVRWPFRHRSCGRASSPRLVAR